MQTKTSKLREWWLTRTPKQRRLMVMGPAAAVVGGLLLWVASFDPAKLARRSHATTQPGNLLGTADSRSMTLASLEQALEEQRRSNEEMRRKILQLEEQVQTSRRDRSPPASAARQPSGPVPPSNARSYLEPSSGAGSSAQPQAGRPSVMPPPGVQPGPGGAPGPDASTPGAAASAQPTGNARRGAATAPAESNPRAAAIRRATPVVTPASTSADSKLEANAKPTDTSSMPAQTGVFVPAGSILTGVLLAGVDAPTGRLGRDDPVPVLARIKEEAILPNRFHANVRECFIVASAVGDLSSERAQLRSEAISCVRRDGGVIETRLAAYGVGEDGKAGLRGRLVSKQGQVISRALIAGFAEGMARAFTPSRIPVLSTSGRGGFEDIATAEIAEAGALSGIGSALDRLSQFYIRMAEQMFPVIEIDAGREVAFVVTMGGELMLMDP